MTRLAAIVHECSQIGIVKSSCLLNHADIVWMHIWRPKNGWWTAPTLSWVDQILFDTNQATKIKPLYCYTAAAHMTCRGWFIKENRTCVQKCTNVWLQDQTTLIEKVKEMNQPHQSTMISLLCPFLLFCFVKLSSRFWYTNTCHIK